ncbi:MAG: AraC family transcriptional regulator [Lachnospiraceae bacterium]|nr:AraC family transcriptional regulator [Lachnospiraceae bacterium]MBD5499571.1 AraC family transcriptional regulator [Lachnospiraceae bacterium]MBD5509637.1 AraC family transcriptional regulator [Lachnospiraceae bacterium]
MKYISGFPNVSYFNRTFKKYLGVTPLAYRNSQTMHIPQLKRI